MDIVSVTCNEKKTKVDILDFFKLLSKNGNSVIIFITELDDDEIIDQYLIFVNTIDEIVEQFKLLLKDKNVSEDATIELYIRKTHFKIDIFEDDKHTLDICIFGLDNSSIKQLVPKIEKIMKCEPVKKFAKYKKLFII